MKQWNKYDDLIQFVLLRSLYATRTDNGENVLADDKCSGKHFLSSSIVIEDSRHLIGEGSQLWVWKSIEFLDDSRSFFFFSCHILVIMLAHSLKSFVTTRTLVA